MTSLIIKREKRERQGKDAVAIIFVCFRERDYQASSLDLQAIRLSEFFGIKRKVVLHGEAYAWTPVLGSFVKLREVGVSPYLGFILYLSTLLMFELNETVRGRLIGPKYWDRIVIIFETQMVQPVTVHG